MRQPNGKARLDPSPQANLLLLGLLGFSLRPQGGNRNPQDFLLEWAELPQQFDGLNHSNE
jgi:hypothetical protein